MLKVKKRDGRITDFDQNKIADAIFKAAQSVGGTDKLRSKELALKVVLEMENEKRDDVPTVEDIQDKVEKILMEEGHAKTAKAYILYRHKRTELRQIRAALLDGKSTSIKLSANSLMILKERYLKKDNNGKVEETPEEMFERVASNVARSDKLYNQDVEIAKNKFYDLLYNLEFMPNSPTLINAGNQLQQLCSCFVIPVNDSIEGIFDAIKHQAIIQKSGGGTGLDFSRLRPRGDFVNSTKGNSSGPISFMKIFNATAQAVTQGGKRKGANMGILRIDHPDILEFITMKEDEKSMENFNISVAVTEKFMQALKDEGEYDLIHPKTGDVVRRLSAKHVFELMILMAWKTGDPGIIFIDRINNSRSQPTPTLGKIESTSACGEQPLLPYEACNLGSINLAKAAENKKINWEKLRTTIHASIHFLDNVIDVNNYPLKETENMCKANRRIGLGVMGFADLLCQLELRYDSQEAVELAREIMMFISIESDKSSIELAKTKGHFPNFKISIYKDGTPIRNATRTTISPTGTISMIADCSSGIEPLFAICFTKTVMDGKELLYINPYFEKIAREKGFYSDELMKKIANRGTIQDIEDIPQEIRDVFRVGYDISPYWHVKIQAAFQEFTDNAVSKTVNFPNWASTKEVEEVYMHAYELGCKGITIYRDGSKDVQVITVNLEQKKMQMIKEKQRIQLIKKEKESCPECNSQMQLIDNCSTCQICGYSVYNLD